ncbi:MAG: hypothetical protein SNF68_03570 [Rikenellaceae bacterium]
MNELEQIEEEKLCSVAEDVDNTIEWEQRLSNVSLSLGTKQIILAQGKITDACALVCDAVYKYWGESNGDNILEPFNSKMSDACRSINDIMCDIIYSRLGEIAVAENGVKEI